MKTINKTMTHNEIYKIALSFLNNFGEDSNSTYLPAAVAFSIQKNKTTLLNLGNEVEQSILQILQHYGEFDENGGIQVKQENIDIVNKELQDLLEIEQEIKVYTFKEVICHVAIKIITSSTKQVF